VPVYLTNLHAPQHKLIVNKFGFITSWMLVHYLYAVNEMENNGLWELNPTEVILFSASALFYAFL